ncbi:glycylpeptide N-tetradecanoyltransferase [Spiromyces aspiralis]|uniref:Glycylpeptide N-tetradecanoyltransferase n=1 Tax=Spiromyces aspiralis TaxID=68401 RepID=A0ACC1HPD6_9FUNG|nr:glycylpeptide N-tetradecanoyltransferase [Spiromyces aspiralis]
MTMHHAEMRLRLPQKPYLSIRDMRKGDEPQVRKLLNRFLKATSDLLPEFQNDDEVSHWFFPKDRVVWTYVVEDPTRPNKLTDFVSFYSLPSSVLKSKGSSDSSQIKAAYLFYYATNPEPEVELTDKDVASSEGSTKKKKTLIKERQIALVKQRLVALVGDALIKARDAGFDVFNCINLLRNELFLEDLKFSKGDGLLYYYLYNWQTRGIDASRIGLVML